jgi:hypothetical protein
MILTSGLYYTDNIITLTSLSDSQLNTTFNGKFGIYTDLNIAYKDQVVHCGDILKEDNYLPYQTNSFTISRFMTRQVNKLTYGGNGAGLDYFYNNIKAYVNNHSAFSLACTYQPYSLTSNLPFYPDSSTIFVTDSNGNDWLSIDAWYEYYRSDINWRLFNEVSFSFKSYTLTPKIIRESFYQTVYYESFSVSYMDFKSYFEGYPQSFSYIHTCWGNSLRNTTCCITQCCEPTKYNLIT